MRKCLIRNKHNKTINSKSFHDSWKQIILNRDTTSSFIYKSQSSANIENSFFESIPLYQEFLTSNQMIYQYEIDFSSFFQYKPNTINERNLFDCFHGILSFIHYYSNNKLNIREVRFHFSGAKNRTNLLSMIQNNPSHGALYDILNIFSYSNINSQFIVNSIRNAYFGLSFLRIKVNPIAYSIRVGSLYQYNGTLTSFTFQGYDEEQQEWIVLDERCNINDLNFDGGYKLFYVQSTNKSFSSFKIQQTEPGIDGFWGFGIAGFDIHGIVSYKENLTVENLLSEESNISQNDNEFQYDEKINMLDLIV